LNIPCLNFFGTRNFQLWDYIYVFISE
jgi:hypothetical protein